MLIWLILNYLSFGIDVNLGNLILVYLLNLIENILNDFSLIFY